MPMENIASGLRRLFRLYRARFGKLVGGAGVVILFLASPPVAAQPASLDNTIDEAIAVEFIDPIDEIRQRIVSTPTAFIGVSQPVRDVVPPTESTAVIAQHAGARVDWHGVVALLRALVQGIQETGLLTLLLISLAVAIGAVLQTSTGMGFALIAVPVIGLIDLAYLPGPFLFANLLLCSSIAIRERRALVVRELKPIAGGMIVGSSLGALLLMQFPAERLGVLFGLFILGAVALTSLSPRVPLRPRNVLIGAVGSGFTGTAAAMHGPPLAMVYQHERPEKVRATLALAYVYGILLAFTTLHLTGRFGVAEMSMGLTLLPGAAIGYGIGRLLVGRISCKTARTTMLSISALGGAALLAKSLPKIPEQHVILAVLGILSVLLITVAYRRVTAEGLYA